MSFKIAFVGAGSLGFTRELFRDIMTVPEFKDVQFSFTDINEQNLNLVTQLCQKDLEANGIKTKIHATLDRREAFKDAKYIVNCVRIGLLEAFQTDIDIPLKYGVDQCVGDTLCIGGIMYGQRVIPALLDFCKDIREVAAPDALLLNYSNPNAMATWACIKYGKVRTLGLCHGEIHGERQIAEHLNIPFEELDFTAAGPNHQTWYLSVKHKGVEVRDKIYDAFIKDKDMLRCEKTRLDVMKRFGYYTTESNGHYSEYVAWYRKRPDDLLNWIDTSAWIHGETGGYLRVCREGRNWFENDYEQIMAEPSKDFTPENRGVEHGSYIIEALETGRVYRGHFNVMNEGCVTNLPDESILEVPCYVGRTGISTQKVGEMPLGCAAISSQTIWVQKLAVEAAVQGNVELLKQAALLDPLTGAVCNPPEVWQMVDEMLVAQEKWLPQYKEAIAQAKINLASPDRIPTRDDYQGAARIPEKTLEEMAAEAEKNRKLAMAAAKENVK